MIHLGDFPTGFTTLCIPFDSFAAATGAPSATSNFAAGDIQIYKNGGTTQRSSSAGITVTTSFDTQTGLQMVVIDLSDNTDAGFYAAGNEYQVAVADITVDGQTLRFWAATFSIERAGGVLAILKSGAAKTTLADGVAHGGTLGSSTATLALSRMSIVSQSANTTAATITGNGTGSGIIASSGTGATGDGIAATSAATNGNGLKLTGNGTGDGLLSTGGAGAGGDGISAVAGGGVDIRGAITGNITGALSGAVGSVTGAVGSVTGNVGGNVTGTVGSVVGAVGSVTGNVGGNVTGSVGSVVGAVGSVTGAVGSVTGAVGSVTGNVGGNVVGSVGSLTTNNDKTGYAIGAGGIANAAFAADAITAAKVASDVTDEIWSKACTEPTAAVAAAPTAIAAVSWLLTLSRNKLTQTATGQVILADDGSTPVASATLSDDLTTAIRAEWV